jgi:hypothetical protein
MSLFKAAYVAFGLAIGTLPALPSLAQGTQQATSEKERVLVEVLTEALPISRLPEIYADFRQAMRDVYLPALRDTIKGNAPGQPELKDDEKDALVKVEKLFDYVLRASDELEPFLQENRETIILDIARLEAKYMTLAEIKAVGEALDLPATRKIFNAVYATSRLCTAYSYADMRSYYAQSAWLNQLKFDLQNNPLAKPDAPLPSPEKIAKAQAVMNDLLRVSRLDDMVIELVRFARDVLAPAAKARGQDADPSSSIDGFMSLYEMNKPVILAAGASMLAVALTEEQLEQLHLLVLSPVMAKSFGLLYEAVRATTSLTSQDIASMQAFSDAAEKKGLFKKRSPEEEAQLKQETEALMEVWKDRAWARLSPETRQGLDSAIKDIEALEGERIKIKDGGGNGQPAPGERRL